MKRKARKSKKKPPPNKSQSAFRKIVPNNETPTTDVNTTEANAQKQPTEPPTRSPSSLNTWTCIATIVIAISTSIYTFAAIWQLSTLKGQLSTLKGQLDYMQEASQLEQRAWIGISNATHEPIEPNKPAKGKFVFNNTGRTPATIITMGHTTCIRPPDFDVETFASTTGETTWKTKEPIQKCIAPNASIEWGFSTSSNPLSDELVESIKSGKMLLYVIGRITYLDIFGTEHQIKFCGIAQPDTNKMSIYHKYNYMD